MSTVVFKVKFNNPNRAVKSAMLNKNHLLYIAKRPRSVHNLNKSYSLFGRVAGLGYNEFGDINNLKQVADHVEDISKNKTTIYKSVISLAEEDAILQDYTTREKYEQLVKNNIKSIAYRFKIPSDRIEYVASLHLEKGHPHIHLMFWEKDQNKYRGQIDKKDLMSVTSDLNKYVFGGEIKQLYSQKNELKSEFRREGKDILSSLIDDYNNFNYDKSILSIPYSTEVEDVKYLNEMYNDLLVSIRNHADTGRLNYQFMPEEIKNKLDLFSLELMRNNEDLKSNFQKYNKVCNELKEKGIGLKEDSSEELLKNLGNITLDSMKKILKREEVSNYESNKSNKQNAYIKSSSGALVELLISFNSILMNANYTNEKNLDNARSLSEQAKKEYSTKMKHASTIDWER